MKTIFRAFRMWIVLTILTGLVYPWVVTAIARFYFSKEAEGDLISLDGKVVGSKWMGQTFEQGKYFWPRPSAISYNPLPSGGSNLSPTSIALKGVVKKRGVPVDLLYASGSGLDPEISPEAALFQIDRVASARKLRAEDLRQLIQKHVEPPDLWILGEPRVNVLLLNLALDKIGGK